MTVLAAVLMLGGAVLAFAGMMGEQVATRAGAERAWRWAVNVGIVAMILAAWVMVGAWVTE